MKNEQIIETLTDFGLSGHESQVYFAALSLGPSSILRIAQEASIKRTSVYYVIESLKQKGVINVEMKGFKKMFVAESPEKLESIIESKRSKLQSMLPEFLAVYNLKGGQSLIKYYEGLESVKSLYDAMLRELKPHDEYLVISNETRFVEADKKYFTEFQRRRAKLSVNTRMILDDTPDAREAKKFEKNLNFKIKLLPKDFNITSNFVIVPNKIVYQQMVPPVWGIVIENKSVIQMHKEMFEIIWRSIPDRKE